MAFQLLAMAERRWRRTSSRSLSSHDMVASPPSGLERRFNVTWTTLLRIATFRSRAIPRGARDALLQGIVGSHGRCGAVALCSVCLATDAVEVQLAYPMGQWGGAEVRRKNAYLVILRAHVDETLAIARIVRSRMRRKIAEADLATKRRRALIQAAALRWRTRIERIVGRTSIGKNR